MKQKNLIFVFADQWRASAAGFMGKEAVKTPNIDAFAKQNTYCTSAVSTCPLCSPHRASLLTGKHPYNTGVFTNCKPELPIRLQDDEICISDVLKQNGYRTGYIGKWHLDTPEERTKAFPTAGAKRWDAFTPPGPGRHGFDFWYSYGAWDAHLAQHYWKDTPDKITADVWSPEHETNVAIDFLNKRDENPFALFISWNPPHPPYDQVPQKYLDLYEDDFELTANTTTAHVESHTKEMTGDTCDDSAKNRLKIKQYYAAISGLDEQFGRLLAYLKAENLLEDTYLVLSADHGDMMGAHGLIGKHVWYEESIGIPFMIAGPEIGQGVSDVVLGSPDVMPTLLDLLALPVPNSVQGESCANELRTLQSSPEKVCYLGCYPGLNVYLAAFEKAGLNFVDFGWRAVRTQTHTFVVDVGYLPSSPVVPKYYLYDLQNDPLQSNPLTVSPQENPLSKELYGKLLQSLKEQQDGIVTYLPSI